MRLLPDLVQEADGVYQPLPPAWLDAVLLAGSAGVALFVLLGNGGAWMTLSIPMALAAAYAVRCAKERRRYGKRGQPLVQVADGSLSIRRGDGAERDFQLPLADFKDLVIYGAAGHRFYRFVRPDGSWIEARPQWQLHTEAAVIAFLQRRLRERVVVEEPQTGFAQARGDGPYHGS